jgi:hypothetical protein
MNLLLRAGIASMLLAMPSVAARADESTIYYHAGSWDAFSGRTDSGQGLCGVGTTIPADGRSVAIRFDIGGEDVTFSLSKPNWSVPAGMKLTVVMQIGSEPPWTETAVGDGHRVRWSMDQTAVQLFDSQFRKASTMTLTFPGGNEQPWTLSLNGSTAIDDAFGRCITDLTQRAQAATQNAGPPATQPFGKGSAPAPSAAPPPSAPR